MQPTSHKPRLFTIGGAHIDRRGQMSAPFEPGASIPGTMREDVGGGAFNALRAAVQRGVHGTILSVRGGDGAGARVAETIAAAGIEDGSVIFLDRATPSYTALLDQDGDVVAALADMGLYELAFPKQMRRAKIRDEIDSADALLVDANLPEPALRRLFGLVGNLPIFAIAISPAKVVRLADCLPALSCLFMNRREALALTRMPDSASPRLIAARLLQMGLQRGVITNGIDPVLLFACAKNWTIVPPPPRTVTDVTGAGDALAGAATAALLRGAGFADAVREGVAAATLAVEVQFAAPSLADAEFEPALGRVPLALASDLETVE